MVSWALAQKSMFERGKKKLFVLHIGTMLLSRYNNAKC